jgi:hypothetical protein
MNRKCAILTSVGAGLLVLSSFGAIFAKAEPGISAIVDQARQGGFPVAESAVPAPVAAPPASQAPQAGPTVKIISFVLTEQNSRVAEICGQVAGADTDFTVVRVTVDPNSKNPGTYNALAGRDGAFCSMVVTYYGTAEASVGALKGTPAMAAQGNPRESK